MSRLKFDPVIHAPNRLQICALLMRLEEAGFQVIREELGVSESVLSKHIGQLQETGYLQVRLGAANGRARKRASLTSKGRRAFSSHIQALMQLAAIAEA